MVACHIEQVSKLLFRHLLTWKSEQLLSQKASGKDLDELVTLVKCSGQSRLMKCSMCSYYLYITDVHYSRARFMEMPSVRSRFSHVYHSIVLEHFTHASLASNCTIGIFCATVFMSLVILMVPLRTSLGVWPYKWSIHPWIFMNSKKNIYLYSYLWTSAAHLGLLLGIKCLFESPGVFKLLEWGWDLHRTENFLSLVLALKV